MFCPLQRDSIVQSHANDVSPSHRRLLPIPNAERRHHHNFRCPMMRKKKANPDRREGKNVTVYKLFHVTQGLLHRHHPRHRWVTEDAQSELPLPHQLNRRSYSSVSKELRPLKEEWGERGGGDGEEGGGGGGAREGDKEGQWSPLVAWGEMNPKQAAGMYCNHACSQCTLIPDGKNSLGTGQKFPGNNYVI